MTNRCFFVVDVFFFQNAVIILKSQRCQNLKRNRLCFDLCFNKNLDVNCHSHFFQSRVKIFARKFMIMRFVSKNQNSAHIDFIQSETEKRTVNQTNNSIFSFSIMFYVFRLIAAIASKINFENFVCFEILLRSLLDNSIILKFSKKIKRFMQFFKKKISFDDEKRLQFHEMNDINEKFESDEIFKMRTNFPPLIYMKYEEVYAYKN